MREKLAPPNSARDGCERALAAMAEPALDATIITATAARARREAADSDARRRDGRIRSPLDGVPVVWKDLFDVAGTVTTRGSALLRDRPPALTDSRLVRQLHRLGMVTLGKSNLSEFAFSGLGINESYGTPINPVDQSLVPGGSSSGSAVAVAAGVVPLAVGTDTSGSVRVPAAFTGCVGYRASYQRYGHNDFHALSPTLDSVGFLARTVDDIRLLDRLLVGGSTVAAPAAEPRLVIPAGEWTGDCTPTVTAQFTAALAALRRAGLSVTIVELESLTLAQRLIDGHGTIVGADAFATYGPLLAAPGGVEPATRRRLLRNTNAHDSVAPLRQMMPELRARFRTELAGAMLLCPTVRHTAPRIADLLVSDAAYDAANASTLRTTLVLSYLGACGISMPACGDGPSAGLLLSAPGGQDEMLLATASRLSALIV